MNGIDRSSAGPWRFPAGTPGSVGSREDNAQGGSTGGAPSSPPAISLPKGGGAIRGIGEEFSGNPVTGTGSLSVPIYTSSGRSGFGLQPSFSYDSGAGNGPFGLGWSLSIPSVTRKTDKGLPRTRTPKNLMFLLLGLEDLVPALKEVNGKWQRDVALRSIRSEDYVVHRYRPRIEGFFARIERWTRWSDGDTHCRSIFKDNVTALSGKTGKSCIADPCRVFGWLICESYDDNGNAILYQYAREDSAGVDLCRANERNRTVESRWANHRRFIRTPWPSALMELTADCTEGKVAEAKTENALTRPRGNGLRQLTLDSSHEGSGEGCR